MIFSFDLELVQKSRRLEAPTYGLAFSGDGDNRRTYHITVCCSSLENVVYLCCGHTQKFLVCSLNRVQLVLNRNGRKDVGQQSQGLYKENINKSKESFELVNWAKIML